MTAATFAYASSHTDRSVSNPVTLRGLAIFGYGVASYTVGVIALVALILAALGVLPLTGGALHIESAAGALAFNLGLLVVFALQHSVMARQKFKQRWTRVIHPAMERSTYVLATGLALLPLLFLWQPLDTVLWHVDAPLVRIAMTATAVAGWAYLFVATFAINHFELFGLQQVWRALRGEVPAAVPFRERWMYRFDRHPIMTGLAIGMWATPDMSLGYLALAAGMTAYAMVGVHFEERALRREWGAKYEDYRRRVGTIVPLPFAR